ncbi:hypothetical protein BDF20DRAFT_837129 [Mycotypha africana]|uniref:uncharacterized protein n=1 Tax=Mycotypha africana TaxID=64632 RepID=UPI00230029DC|nr:uncharacterized protein BDF20DRAFT_837129 [Mycotypha africana]KAI8975782.1 hypothetical protein BDF20DRAFT_837129 [Mycotypha africana]
MPVKGSFVFFLSTPACFLEYRNAPFRGRNSKVQPRSKHLASHGAAILDMCLSLISSPQALMGEGGEGRAMRCPAGKPEWQQSHECNGAGGQDAIKQLRRGRPPQSMTHSFYLTVSV